MHTQMWRPTDTLVPGETPQNTHWDGDAKTKKATKPLSWVAVAIASYLVLRRKKRQLL